jgi:hypothetical protein
LQFKVHHRYQRHWRQIFPSVSIVDIGGKFATGGIDTSGKFATGVNDAGGKLPPISTTPAAILLPVSFTPVANNGSNYQTADNLK